jgi:hypothetical protein
MTKQIQPGQGSADSDEMERLARALADAVFKHGFGSQEANALLARLNGLENERSLGDGLADLDGQKRSALARKKHAQRDFFIADIADISVKDDLASMEHPVFALKPGDRRVRKYQRGGVSIEVRPGIKGLATIHDKDVWIYCISQLVEAMNRNRDDISRTVRFTAYDFMISTNRDVGGDSYRRFGEALERLRDTSIITNIETAGKRERSGFGLVDAWRVIERDGDNRMVAVSVTLPDWLYRSVEAKQVLTLSRDYFRIRKPLDRRIYELVRKHCGAQPSWRVTAATLREKTGSTATLKEFRRSLKALAIADDLPDYRLELDLDEDAVQFFRR